MNVAMNVAMNWAIRITLVLCGLCAAWQATPARAWGFYAHQTTAQIALANLSPQARAKMQRLFAAEAQVGTPQCRLRNLRDASVWPDCIRRDALRWGYTAAWHYRTAPICAPFDPRANCRGGNCVSAQIERNWRLLADENLPAHIRLQALAFVVHFVGDIHQPLHSGDHGDRGGNDRLVDYGVVPEVNLHWIWDGLLSERAITSAEEPLVRRYSTQERAALAGGTVDDWGRESWAIAREIVYPTAFDADPCTRKLPDRGALSEEEIDALVPTVGRRIVQAGLRSAQLLEAAFAPGPLPAPQQ